MRCSNLLKKKFILREKELLKKVKDMTSLDVDVWAARSVAAAFDRLGIKYPLTEKTEEPSFTANWLENCKEPLAKLIKEIREVNKFYSAFIDSIIKSEIQKFSSRNFFSLFRI